MSPLASAKPRFEGNNNESLRASRPSKIGYDLLMNYSDYKLT